MDCSRDLARIHRQWQVDPSIISQGFLGRLRCHAQLFIHFGGLLKLNSMILPIYKIGLKNLGQLRKTSNCLSNHGFYINKRNYTRQRGQEPHPRQKRKINRQSLNQNRPKLKDQYHLQELWVSEAGRVTLAKASSIKEQWISRSRCTGMGWDHLARRLISIRVQVCPLKTTVRWLIVQSRMVSRKEI